MIFAGRNCVWFLKNVRYICCRRCWCCCCRSFSSNGRIYLIFLFIRIMLEHALMHTRHNYNLVCVNNNFMLQSFLALRVRFAVYMRLVCVCVCTANGRTFIISDTKKSLIMTIRRKFNAGESNCEFCYSRPKARTHVHRARDTMLWKYLTTKWQSNKIMCKSRMFFSRARNFREFSIYSDEFLCDSTDANDTYFVNNVFFIVNKKNLPHNEPFPPFSSARRLFGPQFVQR